MVYASALRVHFTTPFKLLTSDYLTLLTTIGILSVGFAHLTQVTNSITNQNKNFHCK